MCVICASLRGKRQPTEEELRQMFKCNPDGAGYMFTRCNKVFVKKGYMSIDSLLESIKAENFTDEDAVVYHFRISTQAGVKPSMTQPFIIGRRLADTEKLCNLGKLGLAHNGVIKMTFDGNKDYSDTALFVSNCASRLLRQVGDNHNKYVHKMLTELMGYGNRLAILGADGYIDLIGSWSTHEGLMVSNLYWVKKPATQSWSYKSSYPSWKHEIMEKYQTESHNVACKKALNFV